MTNSRSTESLPQAGLLFRVMAAVYDAFLLIALLFISASVYHIVYSLATGQFDTTAVVETGDTVHHIEPMDLGPLFLPFLIAVFFGFYYYFWQKNGQTLGMQAWRIQLKPAAENSPISLTSSAIRLAVAVISIAAFGLGYLVLLLPNNKGTWHDRASKTVVVRLPKNKA